MSEQRGDTAILVRELARDYASINWAYFGNSLTPVPIALADGHGRLGCFVADPRRLEISGTLLSTQPWGVVLEVLKHEMAHQYVHEVLGHHDETSHGPSFQRVCERLGIDARASGLPEPNPRRSPILERIRKLLALASSDNRHEAETAMRTAHRLMLRHNLQHVPTDAAADGFGFRHLGRATGRSGETERLLAGLLGEFFFVQPIWVSVFRVGDHKRVSVLEITGRHENLDMAEYVYGFLQQAAEALWREHKRKHDIRSDAERRAFSAGVIRGFSDKLRAERKSEAATGLVWLGDRAAEAFFQRRHPRVRTSRFGSSAHLPAANQGRAAGRDLVLHRPLTRGASKTTRALPRG